MSELLGEVYGTTKQASSAHTSEDAERVAQAEFFTGLCKQSGINIEHLSDEQVTNLWKRAMQDAPRQDKAANAGAGAATAAGLDKSAAARLEWQEKRAAAEKVAEADALGRIIAHAFVDELRKTAAEESKDDGKSNVPPQFLKQKDDDKKKTEEGDEEEKKKESQARAEHLLARLGEGASSRTSNLDEVAGNHAIDLLKQAGVESKLASERINAVYTLGLGESEKIASADSFERAVTLRALEFCAAAGFPVDWSKA